MRFLLVSLVGGLAVVGCRDSTSPELLSVSATFSPSTLHSGDSATIVVTLKNHSLFRAHVSGSACPFYFQILDQSGSPVGGNGATPCIRILVSQTLGPGETIRETFRWVANDFGGTPLQPGDYTLLGYCTWINGQSSEGFVIEA